MSTQLGSLEYGESERTMSQTIRDFVTEHAQKLTALTFWLILVGATAWYAYTYNLTPRQVVQNLVDFMAGSIYGPLIFIGIYALRPLIFFSAALLTVAGGYLFGPIWGIALTVIAANSSAMVAYGIGRYFGKDALDESEDKGVVRRYADRLRNNSFETVLIMRFIFLPYDLVNYLAGFLKIDWKAFLLATVLGSIPGTISFVLFGASIEGDFTAGTPSLNPWALGFAVVIFLSSLAISRYFKRRERQRSEKTA